MSFFRFGEGSFSLPGAGVLPGSLIIKVLTEVFFLLFSLVEESKHIL